MLCREVMFSLSVPLCNSQGFDPPTITVAAGETVTWTNNAGFPHNVVFDEDDVPVRLATRSVAGESGDPQRLGV